MVWNYTYQLTLLLRHVHQSFKDWKHSQILLYVPQISSPLIITAKRPNHLSLTQSSSYIHTTTNILRVPTAIVDPQLPLTSGQDLWPQLEQDCQALLDGYSGQENKSIWWYGVILSSCDYTHSPSMVSVRNNKHCFFQLFFLTEKICCLWAPAPLLCHWQQTAKTEQAMSANVPLKGLVHKQAHDPSYLFIHRMFTHTNLRTHGGPAVLGLYLMGPLHQPFRGTPISFLWTAVPQSLHLSSRPGPLQGPQRCMVLRSLVGAGLSKDLGTWKREEAAVLQLPYHWVKKVHGIFILISCYFECHADLITFSK